MKINKLIISSIVREYFFITGSVGKIDYKYFISKIEEGIKLTTNLNYKTNVIGKQTDFDYFLNDKNFTKIINKIVFYLQENNITKHPYQLADAWGLREDYGDYTKEHHHLPYYISGVLYLNNHTQSLYFPELQQEIKPKQGEFVLFPSYIKHYTNLNTSDKSKYALAFNFKYLTILQ